MDKETFYFTHDYNARNDAKIKQLLTKHGYTGYGLFWAIIEDLYNNANALRLDYDCIAYDLRTDAKTIKSIINDFDLFVIKEGFFGSTSIERRLDKRNEKSKKARQSAFYRWDKNKKDANALQTDSEGNAIKEKKVKEKKVNNIKDPFLFGGLDVWAKWVVYKKTEFNERYKAEATEQTAINKLHQLSNGDIEIAKKIIEQSVGNRWRGFFELKKEANEQRSGTSQSRLDALKNW